MPNDKPITITVELDDSAQALALAQFCKRCHYGIAERLSDPTRKDEPYEMITAVGKVQRALAEAGFAPR